MAKNKRLTTKNEAEKTATPTTKKGVAKKTATTKKTKLIVKNEQNLKSTGRPVGRPRVDYQRVTLTYKLDPTEMALLKKCERKHGARGKRLLMKLIKGID